MRFVVVAWVLSRVVVLGVLLASGHIAGLVHWDGAWYGSIAQHGYEYAADGKQHNVAFFPLFPLFAWPLLHAGISWPVAAAVIANAAFLGALSVLYLLARSRYDEASARWCVALTCLLPPSLFCSVAYPQSLFLLCSAAALYLAIKGRVLAGGLAAAFASAASGLGVPLIAALLINGLIRRRSTLVAGALIGCCGIGAFMFYGWARFGDALAFVHAQQAWRHGVYVDYLGWQAMFYQFLTWQGWRQNAAMLLLPLGLVAIACEWRRLGSIMATYGLLALLVLLFSGTMFSLDRNAYAIAPLLIAFGAILRRVPPVGYVVLALSALLLVIDAGRFAHFEWVARNAFGTRGG